MAMILKHGIPQLTYKVVNVGHPNCDLFGTPELLLTYDVVNLGHPKYDLGLKCRKIMNDSIVTLYHFLILSIVLLINQTNH